MQCFNCNAEANPTLVYCQNCGAPLEADEDDVLLDEEQRLALRNRQDGVEKAKKLFVLALFLFGVTVAMRVIMLHEQTYDHFVSYRVRHEVVKDAKVTPTRQVPDDPDEEFEIPIPSGD